MRKLLRPKDRARTCREIPGGRKSEMEITRTARRPGSQNGVKLWHCERCGKVHLSAGESIASLDREEFAGLIQTAVGIHYSRWEMIATDPAEFAGVASESVH